MKFSSAQQHAPSTALPHSPPAQTPASRKGLQSLSKARDRGNGWAAALPAHWQLWPQSGSPAVGGNRNVHLKSSLGHGESTGALLTLPCAAFPSLCSNSQSLPSKREMKCSFIGFYVGYKMFPSSPPLSLLSSRKHTNLWYNLGKSQSRGTQTHLCLVNGPVSSRAMYLHLKTGEL